MERHRATFVGKVMRIKYYANDRRSLYSFKYLGEPYIEKYTEQIREQSFYDCHFEKPPLEVGELVHISELNITTTIEKRARTTEGGYMYWTDHIVETIDDEVAEKSRVEAEEKLVLLLKEYEEYQQSKKKEEDSKEQQLKDKEIKLNEDDYIWDEGKKWWQFWK